MTKERAEEFAKRSNERNLHSPLKATVVLMHVKGKPVKDGYNVQYRHPDDKAPTIDGCFTFVVVP